MVVVEGRGEYDCAHQTALYNTRNNKSALRSLPFRCPCHFYGGAARRVKMNTQWLKITASFTGMQQQWQYDLKSSRVLFSVTELF